MIRITDQYFWNFVFGLFYVVLLIMATIILSTESSMTPAELTIVDFSLIALASFRLSRLFVCDTSTKWLREQFWDAKKLRSGYVLEKPKTGPRRTLADLFSCLWCMNVWMATIVTFSYLICPTSRYVVLILAIAAVASVIQLLANLVGWQAEKVKLEVER